MSSMQEVVYNMLSMSTCRIIGLVSVAGFIGYFSWLLSIVDQIVKHSDGTLTVSNTAPMFTMIIIAMMFPFVLLLREELVERKLMPSDDNIVQLSTQSQGSNQENKN